MSDIQVVERSSGRLRTEEVFGSSFLHWLYQKPSGKALQSVLCRRWFSALYGKMQDTNNSRKRIPAFINEFAVDLADYVPPGQDIDSAYATFNEFFARRLLPGRRSIAPAPYLAAPAEGRYAAYSSLSATTQVPIKGHQLDTCRLLANADLAQQFAGGPALIIRLCPADYHRFHFPDSGRVLTQYRRGGRLDSVGRLALRHRPQLLMHNQRQISILATSSFGLLAMIEVGAICVGTIIETHNPSSTFERGAEKGYFRFGGSTVILLGTPGSFVIDADLIKNTAGGLETFVRLGEPICIATPKTT